jgi:hypothetical protein
MKQRRFLAGALALVLLLGACAPSAPDPNTVSFGQQRAKAVLENWRKAVQEAGANPAVVVVGDQTGQVGDWEAANGDNKASLMAGLVSTEIDLSATAHPATAKVTWHDGTAVDVPVIDAQAAIVAISASVPVDTRCPACQGLIATAATLTTAPIQTTRGPATGPVWELTIQGTAVKVTRVAIATSITAPPMSEINGGLVMRIDAASATVSGTSVTVQFTGAPLPGDQSCGEDYTADAVESDLAVTILVWRHPHAGLAAEACTAVGALRNATATLLKPLGDRPVLDPATGQPVTLTLTP